MCACCVCMALITVCEVLQCVCVGVFVSMLDWPAKLCSTDDSAHLHVCFVCRVNLNASQSTDHPTKEALLQYVCVCVCDPVPHYATELIPWTAFGAETLSSQSGCQLIGGHVIVNL